MINIYWSVGRPHKGISHAQTADGAAASTLNADS